MRVLPLAGCGIATLIALGACGGGGDSNGPGGSSSGLTARVDGSSWAAEPISVGASAVAGVPGGLVIIGTETATLVTLSLSLFNVTGPGTYALGVGPTVYGGFASLSDGAGPWSTPLNGVAGTVTITTLSGGRVKGTFAYTVEPGVGNSAGGTRVVTQGKFDLPLQGTVAPVPDNQGGSVTATLGGKAYGAWLIAPSIPVAGGVEFSTTSSENALTIILSGITVPGTYTLSTTAPTRFLIVGLNVGPPGVCCWGVTGSPNVGTVTVTSLTATRVKGSFSATLAPDVGKPATTPLVVTNGSFDVGLP